MSNVLPRVQKHVDEKGLFLCVEYVTSIPEFIDTDPDKLWDVLGTILNSAIHLTESGRIIVFVNLRDEDGESRIEIRVMDTGKGLSVEERKSALEPFATARVTGRSRHGDGALGLTVSKQFAKLMDGDISVHGAPGKGSIFNLNLPPTGRRFGSRRLLRPGRPGRTGAPRRGRPGDNRPRAGGR